MQDPQQYLTTIAQMILQGAQASAAQEEERAQRESEMAFRREQLNSQRDFQNQQLALDRTRSDREAAESAVRVEGQKSENEARGLSLRKAKREDAMDYVRGEEQFLATGEYPDQEEARIAREGRGLQMRKAEADVRSAELDADPESPKNKLDRERDLAAIAASNAQTGYAKLQAEIVQEGRDLARRVAELDFRSKGMEVKATALKLAEMNDAFLSAKLGLPTAKDQVEDDRKDRQMAAASFNEAVSRLDWANNPEGAAQAIPAIQSAILSGMKFKALGRRDPASALKIKRNLKAMADQWMGSGMQPDAVGASLVKTMDLMVDAVGGVAEKDTTNKPPPPPETERGRRLAISEAKKSALASSGKSGISSFIEKASDDDFAKIERIFPGLNKEAMAERMYPYWTAAEKELRAGAGGGMYPSYDSTDVMRLALDKASRKDAAISLKKR